MNFYLDSLMNPLAPQDHIPLGITWVTLWHFKLLAALLDPVLLNIIMAPQVQLPTTVLIEGCKIYSALSTIG